MSFWSRAGEWFEKTGDSIGGALTNAREWNKSVGDSNRSELAEAAKWYSKKKAEFEAKDTGIPGFDSLRKSQVYKTPEAYIAAPTGRAVTTALLNDPFNDGNPFSGAAWAKSWELTGAHEVGGKTVEGISFGQVIMGDFGVGPSRGGLGDGLEDSPEAAAERHKAYSESWAGRLTSGVLDAGISFVDPSVTVAKAGAKIRAGAGLVPEGKAAAVAEAARTGAPSGDYNVDRVASRVDDMANWFLAGKRTPAEAATHEFLRNSTERGTLATLLTEAKTKDEIFDVINTVLGDEVSRVRLVEKRADLAEQLVRLGSTPDDTAAVEAMLFDDFGQGMLNIANSKVDSEIAHRMTEVMEEMARLDRVIAIKGEQTDVPMSYNWRGEDMVADDGLQVTELRNGLGGRTISVVKGQLGTRLDGHINIASPADGYGQLDETLRQARFLTGQERNEILSEYARAASDSARESVVMAAEGKIVHSIAKHWGRTDEEAREILRVGTARRAAYRDLAKSRLYSAAPGDKTVAIADPENSSIVVRETAHLKSQIMDFVPMVDPRKVDDMIREASKNRTIDLMMRNVAGQKAGQKMADAVHAPLDPLGQFTKDRLMGITRFWKDAQLIPRFNAYMGRNQVDSQLRLATTMGGAAYAQEAHAIASMGAKVAATANKRVPGAFIPKGKGFEDEDYTRIVGDYLKSATIKTSKGEIPAFDPERIDDIIRNIRATGGNHVALADELANESLQSLRTTGGHRQINPGDPEHEVEYLKVFNRQLANSPVAKLIAQGKSIAELKKLAVTDPDLMDEWLNLSHSWHGGIDEWLARTRNMVNFYLPTPELRTKLIDGVELTAEDYARIFDKKTGVPKMQIHGEAYSPLAENAGIQYYHNTRNKIYSLISDAPENVMARVPLYKYEFSRQMRRLMEAHEGDVVPPKELDRIRTLADRLARRNVKATLFDSHSTTNLAYTMRFIAPFFGAWEDVMKKWGTMFYNNPAALIRLMHVYDAPNEMNIVEDERGYMVDAQGRHWDPNTGELVTDEKLIGRREHFFGPSSAFLGWAGIGKMAADKASFNSVFQGENFWLPGAGPLVAVPVNELIKKVWPEGEDNPIIRQILPFGVSDNSPVDQALPAWARNLHNAFGDTDDHVQMHSFFYKSERAKWQVAHDEWEAGGGVGPEPKEPKSDDLVNKTRNWFLLRWFASSISPFTIKPSPELQFYSDQANAYRQKYGFPQATPEYQAMLKQFTEKYGEKTAKAHLAVEHPEMLDWRYKFYEDFPEFFDLGIQMSEGTAGLNMNLASVEAYRKYKKELKGLTNPDSAFAIVGPDTAYGLDANHAYSSAARGFLMTNGQRTTLRPDEALMKAEEEKGWVQFQRVRTRVTLALENRGLHSMQQKGAEDIKQTWDTFVRELEGENRFWAAARKKFDDGAVQSMLTDLSVAMKQNRSLAERPDMKAMSSYINVRNKVRAELDNRGLSSVESKGAEDLKMVWDQFTAELGAETPGFEQVYNRFLERDKVVGRIG